MTVQELHDKMTAAYEKVEKCRNTIERHKAQLDKKVKACKILGIEPNPELARVYYDQGNREAWNLLYDIRSKQDDIKGADGKLREAERVAENWRVKYQRELDREQQIETAVPPIIREFIHQWKEEAIVWQHEVCNQFKLEKSQLHKNQMVAMYEIIDSCPAYERYREWLDRNFSAKDMGTLINANPRKVMQEALESKGLTDRQIGDYLRKKYGTVTIKFSTEYKDQERTDAIRKFYEQDAKAKIIDLMNRISIVVGEITDASGLFIGKTGGIEGLIRGTIGVARIETIGAGGYNIQCFHYRTLVHKYQ